MAAAAELAGLFAVYKPAGVAWGRVREAVETRLLRGERGRRDPLDHPIPGATAGPGPAHPVPGIRQPPLTPRFLPVSISELNAAPGAAPRQRVRFLPTPAPGGGGAVELVAARVPVLADHPLGKGTAGPAWAGRNRGPVGAPGRRRGPAPSLSPLQSEARGSGS